MRVLPLPGGRFVVPGNRWDLVAEAEPAEPTPSISVIVPYYQDRRQLDLVLEGLRLQDLPVHRFEVIVVDDGSPEPLALPPEPGNGPRIRTFRQPDQGFRAAAARNLGAAFADGQILCFLDQDTVPEPGYLRHLTRLPALVPDALVVGRRQHAELDSWTPSQLRSWFTEGGPAPTELPAPGWLTDAYRESQNLLITDDTSYRFVISAVMCCTADLFREIGGFDESFTSYGGEDWELAYRAYNAGAVLAHEPAAVAWHDGPDWGERGDPEDRRRVKAEEKAALARRIPSPTHESASPDQPVDLVVVWPGNVCPDPAELQGLLASDLNLALYLDPGQAERWAMPADPRLRTTPVPDDVLARARDLITVDGVGRLTVEALTDSRSRLRSGVAGRVLGAGPDGPMTHTAVTQRATRRAARWQALFPDTDLVDVLFSQDRAF
jgi:GT2 family glycosyltransferase